MTISMARSTGTEATDDDSWRAGRWLERFVELSRYAAGFAGSLGWVGFDGRFFAVGLPNGVYDTY